ncbi:hypothetical protein ABIA33_005656 [Streptacidiphilus sp. MAP12-16]|uniref:hypothetical protein n=1 Tax=Streptacidiphilus sp. MAP12-16 TaxID=3156300 RepID=UPI003512246D
MHRITTVLGALALASTLALALPTSAATASVGNLFLNGVRFENPDGCITVPVPGVIDVANFTQSAVRVYSGTHCDGDVTREVPRGDRAFGVPGRSVEAGVPNTGDPGCDGSPWSDRPQLSGTP